MGVHVSKWLFTRQPFKKLSQIGYIHGCRVSTNIKSLFTRQPFQSQFSRVYILCYTKSLFTRQPFQSQVRYIHGSRVYILCHTKSLFTRQPFKIQVGYIHCSRVHTKTVIYTAAVQEPTRLLYISAGCINKIVIYTAAVQEPIQAKKQIARGSHTMLNYRAKSKRPL